VLILSAQPHDCDVVVFYLPVIDDAVVGLVEETLVAELCEVGWGRPALLLSLSRLLLPLLLIGLGYSRLGHCVLSEWIHY
jgi:hypothetical protein